MSARLRQLLPAGEADPSLDAAQAVRTGLLVIAAAFLGFGGWMALAPLSGAIIAPGAVKVDMNRKTVQHQEGGIVSEIRVRDGDRVSQGQVLIVLEDVRVDATLEQLKMQLDSERVRQARLAADASLSPEAAFPADLVARARNEMKVAEMIRRETALFYARRQTLGEQVELVRQQRRQAEEEASALGRQIAAESRALSLQRDELVANRQLQSRGFVGEMRVKAVDRAAADYEARVGEHQAELARARQKAAELSLRMKTLENQFMQGAADEMKESGNKLFDLEERLRPTRDAVERQKIVAPIAGEVVDLKVTSVGAVIGPRDALLDIVPRDGKLIVEGRVRPEDIESVRVGGEADVRLTAFKARTTPVVVGHVVYVAGDRLVDRATGQPYYTVQVDVPARALKEAGDLRLQAGMPAEVFIRTAERTLLEYLLEPMTAYLRRALREP